MGWIPFWSCACCNHLQPPAGWEEKEKARKAGQEVKEEPEGVTVSELIAQYGDDAFYTEVGENLTL